MDDYSYTSSDSDLDEQEPFALEALAPMFGRGFGFGASPGGRRSPGPPLDPSTLVEEDKEDPNQLRCWASSVKGVSSQYNSSSWGADQTLGPPKVYPRYGDITGAWAQGSNSSNEWIELNFPEAIYIQKIFIYETYHSGAVTKVAAYDPTKDTYVTVYEGQATCITHSRIFEVDVKVTPTFSCSRLRIEMNCTVAGSWCEIDAVSIHGKRYNLPDAPVDTLCEDFAKLVNDPVFSDVCFEVEGKKVYAHKAILVARSDYFKAMFTSNMEEASMTEISLQGAKYDTFLALLEFIYTGRINCSPSISVDLLRLADMYSLEALKQVCMLQIPKLLTEDNVVDILYSISQSEGLAIVQQLCYNFIAKRFQKVTKSEAFCKLPQEQMLELVQATASKLKI